MPRKSEVTWRKKNEINFPVYNLLRKTRPPSFWQDLFFRKVFTSEKIEIVSPTTFPENFFLAKPIF